MQLRTIQPHIARRFMVASQYLEATPHSMLETIQQLGCLQIDPLKIVIQTQYMVLFSRLGAYDFAEFDRLMWQERQLFEYWAHAASIVLTQNFPIHRYEMRGYETSNPARQEWVKQNSTLRQHILDYLREHGASLQKDLGAAEKVEANWHSSGWTANRNTDRMLDYLWCCGVISVAGRAKGGFRLWDLSERIFPAWTPRDEWSDDEIIQRALLIALNGLGIGTPKNINFHFTRNNYPNMKTHLKYLEEQGKVERVQIEGIKGEWYLSNRALLESIEKGEFAPRYALLSPFDNLLCDRDRTEKLFDFFYRVEIYTPKHKRQYGYYVLPFLDGDKLVGRIDPKFDRKKSTLQIHAIHWENAPTPEQRVGLQTEMERLATWLGAKELQIAKE
jgi:uncharacterized protein